MDTSGSGIIRMLLNQPWNCEMLDDDDVVYLCSRTNITFHVVYLYCEINYHMSVVYLGYELNNSFPVIYSCHLINIFHLTFDYFFFGTDAPFHVIVE